MILNISCLPVILPEEKSCGSTADECSNDSECGSLLSNSTDYLDDENPGNKTCSWASNEDNSDNLMSIDEQKQHEENDSGDTYCGDLISNSQSQIFSDEASGPDISDGGSLSAKPDNTNPGIDDSVSEDVSIPDHGHKDKITTQGGRVVKRVNHLIETMAQKPFKMPNWQTDSLKSLSQF